MLKVNNKNTSVFLFSVSIIEFKKQMLSWWKLEKNS